MSPTSRAVSMGTQSCSYIGQMDLIKGANEFQALRLRRKGWKPGSTQSLLPRKIPETTSLGPGLGGHRPARREPVTGSWLLRSSQEARQTLKWESDGWNPTLPAQGPSYGCRLCLARNICLRVRPMVNLGHGNAGQEWKKNSQGQHSSPFPRTEPS